MQPFESEVRQFVIDSFLFGEGGDEIAASDSLLEKGLIDSTGILELVGFLQRTFEIKIDDREIIPANLDSIQKIAAFVRQKVGDAGGQGNQSN